MKLNSIRLSLLCASILFLALTGVALASDVPATSAPDIQPLWTDEAADAATPAPLPENGAVEYTGSCYSQYCGNTGTRYGYGNSCSAAETDLRSVLNSEAYNVCPGVVTGVYINLGGCSGTGVSDPECKFSGNANIYCKICPGQFCGLEV